MTRLRILAATVAIGMAGAFAGAGLTAVEASAAHAAQPAARTPTTSAIASSIPCSIGGVASTCQLTVTSFQVVDGVLTAVGTVSGGGVTVPFSAPVQASGTCPVLDLTLGPLHLDLLGLVVDLNQVHLQVTAQSGAGNLLGNLLCAVAGLLDANNVNGIVRLLNQILAAL